MSLFSRSRFVLTGSWMAPMLSTLLLAAAPSAGHAQGAATGKYMAEAVVRVTNMAARAKFKKYGYIEGISILGGWVNEKASLTFTTPLTAGVNYLFLAGGDNDATDVDFEILDATGQRLAFDVGIQPEAIVTFTPTVTGTYTLRMTLFQSRQSVPCVCVTTILKRNGWDVPVANLDKATDKIIGALKLGDQAAQRLGKRLDLRRSANQWAFFGGVLRQGGNLSVIKMSLGFGGRVCVGAGDTFSDVINLDLEDVNGRAIKQDLKNNPVAVLDHTANGGTYGLRVHNIRARAPSVVLMAIMDIR